MNHYIYLFLYKVEAKPRRRILGIQKQNIYGIIEKTKGMHLFSTALIQYIIYRGQMFVFISSDSILIDDLQLLAGDSYIQQKTKTIIQRAWVSLFMPQRQNI